MNAVGSTTSSVMLECMFAPIRHAVRTFERGGVAEVMLLT